MVERLDERFPGLRTSAFRLTSPTTRDYNCIAWAANDATRWWWPDPDPDNDAVYWPPNVPIEEAAHAFAAAFATLGYAACSGEVFEPGFEKVALFAIGSVPTHAARQLPNGRWTSKLGRSEDIEHELNAVSGAAYGAVVLFLKRATNASTP